MMSKDLLILVAIVAVIVIGFLGRFLFKKLDKALRPAPSTEPVEGSPPERPYAQWEGKDPNGNEIAFRWNKETNFWEQLLNQKPVPNKCNFKEVTNAPACVIIRQEGPETIILTKSKATLGVNGYDFALGTFVG